MGAVAEAVNRMVSVDEYLNSSYRPDCELIDGRLEEKPMPTRLHSYVQVLIGQWFQNHKRDWGTLAMSEARTRVREDRFRLPDVSVVLIGVKMIDAPMEEPPLIAIEIMSREDTFASLRDRASDLSRMGAEYIWLLDPAAQKAYAFDGEDWRTSTMLQVAESPIHLDLHWLWTEVQEQL